MIQLQGQSTSRWLAGSLMLFLLFFGNAVVADEYQKTIQMFKEAKDSARFFDTAYGYAVFPTVGKAGFVVGGGYGKGRVYVHGRHVGDATVVDLSVGFQLGAQAFSRCPPWRAKRRRVVPGSREATRDTRRAEGAKGDPKGASERGVQSYGRPVCSRNELAMLWRNAG